MKTLLMRLKQFSDARDTSARRSLATPEAFWVVDTFLLHFYEFTDNTIDNNWQTKQRTRHHLANQKQELPLITIVRRGSLQEENGRSKWRHPATTCQWNITRNRSRRRCNHSRQERCCAYEGRRGQKFFKHPQPPHLRRRNLRILVSWPRMINSCSS